MGVCVQTTKLATKAKVSRSEQALGSFPSLPFLHLWILLSSLLNPFGKMYERVSRWYVRVVLLDHSSRSGVLMVDVDADRLK